MIIWCKFITYRIQLWVTRYWNWTAVKEWSNDVSLTHLGFNDESHVIEIGIGCPPFVTRKNQLSRIFAKIQPENYRFSGISNPQRFERYLFSFPRYWDNIGFNIFLTVHIFELLIKLFLQCLKRSSSGIRICLNFFDILHL